MGIGRINAKNYKQFWLALVGARLFSLHLLYRPILLRDAEPAAGTCSATRTNDPALNF
jgi:hypothetical protein